MDYKLKCDECGATAWTSGQPDGYGGVMLDDESDLVWDLTWEPLRCNPELLDDLCQHEEYSVIDSVSDDPRDEYNPDEDPDWGERAVSA